MARRVVTVKVERLAAEPGHWCSACALPSGWLVWVILRFGSRMTLGRRTWCDECGGTTTVVLGGP